MSLSPNFPIAYIEIRTFSHATEDLEKVESATKNLLPEILSKDLVFSKQSLIGHHGNPIVSTEAKLDEKRLLVSFLEKIANTLSPIDKEQLSTEIKLHIEKHNLYLRFDKQNAFLGTPKLTSNDPIHIKIRFKNKTPEQIIEFCNQVGLF